MRTEHTELRKIYGIPCQRISGKTLFGSSNIILLSLTNRNQFSVFWWRQLTAPYFSLTTVFWSTCHWIFNYSPVFADKSNPSPCFLVWKAPSTIFPSVGIFLSICHWVFENYSPLFADKPNPSPCFLVSKAHSAIFPSVDSFLKHLPLGFQLFSCFCRQIKSKPLFSGASSSQRDRQYQNGSYLGK